MTADNEWLGLNIYTNRREGKNEVAVYYYKDDDTLIILDHEGEAAEITRDTASPSPMRSGRILERMSDGV